LTYDIRTLPVLLIGSVVAYLFTVLVMKRSILTEKVARRGYHVSREYSVDPLERLSVSDVMATDVVTVPAALPVRELLADYFLAGRPKGHQGYPVVDQAGELVGVVTRSTLLENWIYAVIKGAEGTRQPAIDVIITYDLIQREPITVFPWESCRTAAERMAQAGVGRLPVVSPEDPRKVIGMITRSDLLKPRARTVEEELKRERFYSTRRTPDPAP
jgi:CBS-domain-containing membrane protein